MDADLLLKRLPPDLKGIVYRFRHNMLLSCCMKEMMNNFYECNENLYHIYEIVNGYLYKVN